MTNNDLRMMAMGAVGSLIGAGVMIVVGRPWWALGFVVVAVVCAVLVLVGAGDEEGD